MVSSWYEHLLANSGYKPLVPHHGLFVFEPFETFTVGSLLFIRSTWSAMTENVLLLNHNMKCQIFALCCIQF